MCSSYYLGYRLLKDIQLLEIFEVLMILNDLLHKQWMHMMQGYQ